MRIKYVVAILIMATVSTGCATSNISITKVNSYQHNLDNIAIGLEGDESLSDALVAELKKQNFNVIDRTEVYKILQESGIKDIYTNDTIIVGYLKDLRNKNQNEIDAFLSTKMVALKFNGTPESADLFLYSTHSGDLIVSIKWVNGWGGMAGSPADANMSKNSNGAALEIVAELMKHIGR